jgi:hypothetical protein
LVWRKENTVEEHTSTAGGTEEGRREFLQVLGQFDAPAFVRRARAVQAALDGLAAKCRRQRDEWLGMPRLRVGLLHALAGDWAVLRPFLAEGAEAVLEQLLLELNPKLRSIVTATTSARALRRALRELIASLERFNRRWTEYLARQDFRAIDEARDGYNKYYVLEKECALRSPVLARRGYQPLAPMSVAELEALLPLLPVPRLR